MCEVHRKVSNGMNYNYLLNMHDASVSQSMTTQCIKIFPYELELTSFVHESFSVAEELNSIFPNS